VVIEVYDPLNYHNIAGNVADALVRSEKHPLPPECFVGAGIYAMYYSGTFDAYASIASAETPIYVGKAVPAGARRGEVVAEAATERNLHQRLREHARSIEHAQNIELAHFGCRFLVLPPIWITISERLLIERYRPVWNVCVSGFGIHAPGRGRGQQRRSDWDTLHPGRPFARELPEGRPLNEILEAVKSHLSH
jgi:hypothetical protein